MIAMMAEEPDDLLSPDEIAAEIKAAGISLTTTDLRQLIERIRRVQ